MDRIVIKTLSRNDLGLSGSHQAGILVPKTVVRQAFFPSLREDTINPHCMIVFYVGDKEYELNYIHYNSRLFGKGTRNEYRLTRLNRFYKDFNCNLGDKLVFTFSERQKKYRLAVEKKETDQMIIIQKNNVNHPLIIHANWEF